MMVEFVAEAILNCSTDVISTPPDCPLLPALDGLIARWDASVYDSMTLTLNGDGSYSVITWDDQSGNNNDLASVASAPKYIAAGFNSSYPCLDFEPFQFQSLACSSFPMGTGSSFTIFAAIRVDNDPMPHGRLVSYTAPAQTNDYDNVGSFGISRNGGTSNLTYFRNSEDENAAFTLNSPMRLIVTLEASGALTIYINGSVVTTGSMTAASFVSGGTFRLGADFTASLFHGFFGGAIAEFGICSASHDADTVAEIDAHLECKWGF